MEETLNDTVTLGDQTVTVNRGSWAALRVRDGKVEPTPYLEPVLNAL